MSRTINYSIRFYSYWHCGSGLAAGASADSLVVKDDNGLPFIPGKTIKGLLRECMEEYSNLEDESINEIFGRRVEGGINESTGNKQGTCYFSNATLSDEESQQIRARKWQKYLYKSIASTSIDEETVTAKDYSLRTMEVAIPCTLHGEIEGIADGYVEELKLSLRMIKRLGVNRNRGLGRCDFIIGGENDESAEV